MQRLFDLHATATPEALALASADTSLTYGELQQRVTTVALELRRKGVGPEVVVGLCIERSPAYAIGALAILKAGGAYLSIDPQQPADRMGYMLRDANASLVVASPKTADRLANFAEVVELNLDTPITAPSEALPEISAPDEALAYVIYTSGSTGRPKGVAISHASLLNLVRWHQRAFGVTSADRATAMASPGFDAAVWELWPYLTAGASVHYPDDHVRAAPEELRDWLVTHGITIAFAATPIAERLIGLTWPRSTALHTMLTGGDTLTIHPPASLPFDLVNNYGPTEATVVATSGIVPRGTRAFGAPRIGRPIDNLHVHLLDEQLRPVPAGTSGEICIAGVGLARGYVNDADLTARSFVIHSIGGAEPVRLYRTGDLGRLDTDGEIAFLGRLDEQVKIRGHRIAPAEIVVALLESSAVEAATVQAWDVVPGDAGDNIDNIDIVTKRLVAYLVVREGHEVSHGELVEQLRSRLPDYMIPSAFALLDELPLTPNGKIDRAALAPPAVLNLLRDDVGPRSRSSVETVVAEIVSSLLGLSDVGVDENFFLLGGHSLLGAQMIARVRETFGVDMTLRRLFEAPTVAGIALEVERLIDADVSAMSDADVLRLVGADAPPPPTHP